MGGKINAYLDCVSPYSYYALLYLQRNRSALRSHGIEVEFTPVFLGGINVGSGNKPPWTLPAKQKYGAFDSQRAQKYFGVQLKTPSFFPILSLLPQRCMCYTKDNYTRDKFEAAFAELWIAMWKEQMNLETPEIMKKVLLRHFSPAQVKEIMEGANSPKYKQKLLDNTKMALEAGAFGCPWFVVTNNKGLTEPFFGSDRFHYMWQFLEIPWLDLCIVEKSKM